MCVCTGTYLHIVCICFGCFLLHNLSCSFLIHIWCWWTIDCKWFLLIVCKNRQSVHMYAYVDIIRLVWKWVLHQRNMIPLGSSAHLCWYPRKVKFTLFLLKHYSLPDCAIKWLQVRSRALYTPYYIVCVLVCSEGVQLMLRTSMLGVVLLSVVKCGLWLWQIVFKSVHKLKYLQLMWYFDEVVRNHF